MRTWSPALAFLLCLTPTLASAGKLTTSRSIHVAASPTQASRIVSRMQVSDGYRVVAPPGVSARRVGPGAFEASGPGTRVSARLSVRPAAGGGSIITETTTAQSILPGGATAATILHAAATSLSTAFDRATGRRR